MQLSRGGAACSVLTSEFMPCIPYMWRAADTGGWCGSPPAQSVKSYSHALSGRSLPCSFFALQKYGVLSLWFLGHHLACSLLLLQDIGCGHSFCEQCLSQHPRSFRYCPECRTRASNPHVNISLLRLVDVQGPAGQCKLQDALLCGDALFCSGSGEEMIQNGRTASPNANQVFSMPDLLLWKP